MTEFISILTKSASGESPKLTKKVFDKEFYIDKETEDINIYNYAKSGAKKQVYITKDIETVIPVLSGINEKFMFQDGELFSSKLKLIIFSNYHELDNNYILAQLTSISECYFKNHNLVIKLNQFILVGLNDEDYDLDIEGLHNLEVEHYTLSIIKKKGIEQIINKIIDNNKENKLLAYFNLEVFESKIAPCVNRRNLAIDLDLEFGFGDKKISKNGLSYENLISIGNLLKDKIDYLVISGFDATLDNQETGFPARLTNEIVQILYRNVMNLKEKKINIFNENSRFLIYRQLEKTDDQDVGWYILRFVDIETKNKILEKIEDDKIYTIDLDDYSIDDFTDTSDNSILISATTMEEQNKKTYYGTNTFMECVLFPDEKVSMVFELVNTF